MDTPQPNAEPALEEAHQATPSKFDHLCELLKDFKAPGPCVDWGHVGSLAHLQELLAQVIEHLQPTK